MLFGEMGGVWIGLELEGLGGGLGRRRRAPAKTGGGKTGGLGGLGKGLGWRTRVGCGREYYKPATHTPRIHPRGDINTVIPISRCMFLE